MSCNFNIDSMVRALPEHLLPVTSWHKVFVILKEMSTTFVLLLFWDNAPLSLGFQRHLINKWFWLIWQVKAGSLNEAILCQILRLKLLKVSGTSTSDAQELLKLNQAKKYLQKHKNGDYSTNEKIQRKECQGEKCLCFNMKWKLLVELFLIKDIFLFFTEHYQKRQC